MYVENDAIWMVFHIVKMLNHDINQFLCSFDAGNIFLKKYENGL